jgi:RecQ family ATP-dependent DNA helicase
MELRAALASLFGHTGFRPHQEEIIRRIMAGRSVLGVLPTGAGKSLCYQLPSLLLARPTLVISPLIALMQDQLDGLPPAVYPKATLVNSSVAQDELERRLAGIEAGTYQLIYAAPERLRQQRFLQLMRRVGLSLVVVDEAHCVSVWGHDFRPDYLFIRKALAALAEAGLSPTLLALTATATREMQAEIAGQLGRPLETVAASTFRPNLRLEVLHCANADDKMRRLAAVCRETPGATIVYANSRERCEKLAAFLRQQGLPAAHYHAGLEREARQQTQERFMLDRVRIIVATVAFGMGVDKPNVRLVVHFQIPESLENYAQEAGRAGRDGRFSRCVLLYAASDKGNLSRWLRQEEIRIETVRDVYRALQARLGKGSGRVSPDELQCALFGEEADPGGIDARPRVAVSMLERCGLLTRHPDAGRDMSIEMLPPPPTARADLEALLVTRRRHAEARLAEMVAYVEGQGCRHAAIARHFDQALPPCGTACDFCLGIEAEGPVARPTAPTVEQVPDLGVVILKTVLALPFPLGRTGLVKVLAGAVDSVVKKDRCELYGALAGFSVAALNRAVDGLFERGLLTRDPDDEYRRLFLSAAGREALDSGAEILPNPNLPKPPRPSRQSRAASSPHPQSAIPGAHHPLRGYPAPQSTEGPLTGDEDDRFERLRAWRRIEANRANLPPYVICHDTTLRALARANPQTLEELATIPGMGPRRIESHGAAILEVLNGEEADVGA